MVKFPWFKRITPIWNASLMKERAENARLNIERAQAAYIMRKAETLLVLATERILANTLTGATVARIDKHDFHVRDFPQHVVAYGDSYVETRVIDAFLNNHKGLLQQRGYTVTKHYDSVRIEWSEPLC